MLGAKRAALTVAHAPAAAAPAVPAQPAVAAKKPAAAAEGKKAAAEGATAAAPKLVRGKTSYMLWAQTARAGVKAANPELDFGG